MSRLSDIVNETKVFLFGNQFDLLGKIATIVGAIGYFNADSSWQGFYIGLGAIGLGTTLPLNCGLGGTFRAYKRTKEHIRNFGELDENFAKNAMFAGYCYGRGVYLAAKEMDKLESFGKAKADYKKEMQRIMRNIY